MSELRLSSRAWVLGGVVVGLLILVAAWLVVISPVRSDASQLRDSAASVQTQNTVISARNNGLRDQAHHRQQLVTELTAALQGLPSGAGLPVFSRQLATQASARGLSLTGVTIGTSTTATPTTTAPSADVTSAITPPVGTAATVGDATGSAGPTAIPVTVTTDGPALQELLFLRDVQQVGPRLVLVTSTALAPTGGNDQAASIDAGATMTLQLTVFTNPLSQSTRQKLAQLIVSNGAPGDK